MKTILKNKLFYIAFILVIFLFLFLFNFLSNGYFNKLVVVLGQNIEETQSNLGNNEENKQPTYKYIEVVDGCTFDFQNGCVNVRSGPGEEYDIVLRLRTGMVLKVSGIENHEGKYWYKISFDGWLRYPERLGNDIYVAADFVKPFMDVGVIDLNKNDVSSSTKRIVIDRSDQTLYAYDGENLFLETKVSTGLLNTPTPRGIFTINKKMPSRYMQGPIPGVNSDQAYDLPGVPWNLYFTDNGLVIHGAYWHNSFGEPHSNGCVNLPPEMAKKLYEWAEVGMKVEVRE